MKLLKRISVLVMMIAVVAAFAGCGKETSVVGTWEGDEYTYTIKKDVLSLSDGDNTVELNKK